MKTQNGKNNTINLFIVRRINPFTVNKIQAKNQAKNTIKAPIKGIMILNSI